MIGINSMVRSMSCTKIINGLYKFDELGTIDNIIIHII